MTGEHIGVRVRELRRRLGLSQAQVAGSRLSESYVSLIESGRRRPTAEVVEYLAQMLGCPVSQLSGETSAPGLPHAELMVRRAEIERSSGNAVSALTRFQEARERSEAIGATALASRAREGIAQCLEQLGKLNEAIQAWEEILEFAQRDPTNGSESTATVGLCRCLREAGDLDRAVAVGEAFWNTATPIRERPASEEVIVVGATLLVAYLELDDMTRAEGLSAELMALADDAVTPKALGAVYWNAALVAEAGGRVAEAVRCAERAQASFAETADIRNRARLQVALGGLQLRKDPPDEVEALRLLSAAEPVLAQFGSVVDIAYCRTEAARAHLHLGAFGEALDIARETLTAFDEAAPPLQIARTLMVAAAACHAQGDEARAVLHAQRAAELLESAGANKQAASSWAELAELNVTIGNQSAALDSYRHATQLLGARRTAGATHTRRSTEDASRSA